MKILKIFNDKYNILIQSFLFIEKQNLNENAFYAEGFHNVFKNDKYHFAQIFIRGFVLNNYFRIKISMNLIKLDPQYSFVQYLIIAYKSEYELRVINFDSNALK